MSDLLSRIEVCLRSSQSMDKEVLCKFNQCRGYQDSSVELWKKPMVCCLKAMMACVGLVWIVFLNKTGKDHRVRYKLEEITVAVTLFWYYFCPLHFVRRIAQTQARVAQYTCYSMFLTLNILDLVFEKGLQITHQCLDKCTHTDTHQPTQVLNILQRKLSQLNIIHATQSVFQNQI